MASKAEAYLHKKNIPQLFESLMIALMYEQPDEPVTFLTSCLAEVCDVGPACYEWGSFKQLIARRSTDSLINMEDSLSTTKPLTSEKSVKSTTDSNVQVQAKLTSAKNIQSTADPQTPVENTRSAPVESTQSDTDPQAPMKTAKSATDPLVLVEDTQSVTVPVVPMENTQSATDPQAPVESAQSTPQTPVESMLSATNQQTPVENTGLTTNEKTKNCLTEIGDQLVIFIMGGPGSGKGTQCSKIVKEFGFVHICAGELLRGEIAKKTEHGQMIQETMERGELVPPEITVSLLKTEMLSSANREATGFIIDGFPRELSQYKIFRKQVCEGSVAMVFECSDEVMIERLSKRAETSRRVDDNPDTIKKRLVTHHQTTGPLIEHFEQQGKVRKVNAEMSEEEVYSDLQALIKQLKETIPTTPAPASEETTTTPAPASEETTTST